MAKTLLRYTTYYIVILVVCIDQGDGRWKEKDKETLKHDIELYRRMAEKIEREIETFYDDYPERLEQDNIDSVHFRRVTNILGRNLGTGIDNKNGDKLKQSVSTTSTNVFNVTQSNIATEQYGTKQLNHTDAINESSIEVKELTPKWPKFDDILLEIGKKYDWKNDRWIKVRQKLKKIKIKTSKYSGATDENNSIGFHEKHKFSYKIVNLNRTKSRRSVVVAVSAVR